MQPARLRGTSLLHTLEKATGPSTADVDCARQQYCVAVCFSLACNTGAQTHTRTRTLMHAHTSILKRLLCPLPADVSSHVVVFVSGASQPDRQHTPPPPRSPHQLMCAFRAPCLLMRDLHESFSFAPCFSAWQAAHVPSPPPHTPPPAAVCAPACAPGC
jgi:hypothetical protein